MLDQLDRQALLRWCHSRRVKWAEAAPDSVLLVAESGAGRATRLRPGEEGWQLETEAGEALAAASDLPALLDAMDAGVGVR